MTYNRFNKLYKTNNLPQEDYSTYVARDAHMTSKKRSTLRYGTHNECAQVQHRTAIPSAGVA